MMCARVSSSLFSSSTFSLIKLQPKKSFSQIPLSLSSSNSKTFFSTRKFSTKMSAKTQTIEHVVLFKVKDETDSSKINSMIKNINTLISLDEVLHLTAGPILRNRSSSFKFTHLLHSRYKTKEDLNAYSAHPDHQSAVKAFVLPICDDVMAVDWISDLEDPVVVKSGSAMRLTFMKLKEDLGENVKGKVLDVIGGIKDRFDSIEQISFGENFSPARAKGFTIASIAVFPGLSDLDGLDSNEEMVKEQKEKVKDLVESVIVLDYVVPALQSANL